MAKPSLREEYEARLTQVVHHLVEHLGEPFDLAQLADQASYSRFHFHRLFQSLLGESPGEMTRRLLLERAACLLAETEESVLSIALSSGYASGEAFSRAFAKVFGATPSEFRRSPIKAMLPCANGLHFDSKARGFTLKFITSEPTMTLEIKQTEPVRILSLAHKGPYYLIGGAFDHLFNFMVKHGLPMNMTIAIYHDDPNQTPESELRSEACMILPADLPLPEADMAELGFREKTLDGGTFAVATYQGGYDGLGAAWGEFMGQLLPSAGHEPSGICYEAYLVHDMENPANCVTQLYQQVG